VMVMQRRGEQARRNAARRGDGQSPWADTDSWRLGSASWQQLAFDTAGQSYALAARWNGAGALTILNEGVESTWTVRIEGNRVRLGSEAGQTRHRVWVDGERVEVTGEGRRHRLTLRAVLGVVGSNQEEQQALTAPMAGKVIESRVQPGHRVNEGDTLMVVEAMKMEHRIIAARDGVIEMVLADVGDFVEGNAVLLRFADDT
ncbi:MAG: biotin/lipoyl-containing protein, partial [Pseudomonadota bacterium]|nr:biotin/lipoyl-containing protein [Pseudomonadota bacterium]